MTLDEVAAARLDLQPGAVLQGHLQTVVTAIQLEILRREAEYVDKFGLGGDAPETLRKVVAVLDEGASGRIRQFGHNVRVGRGAVDLIQHFYVGGHG